MTNNEMSCDSGAAKAICIDSFLLAPASEKVVPKLFELTGIADSMPRCQSVVSRIVEHLGGGTVLSAIFAMSNEEKVIELGGADPDCARSIAVRMRAFLNQDAKDENESDE